MALACVANIALVSSRQFTTGEIYLLETIITRQGIASAAKFPAERCTLSEGMGGTYPLSSFFLFS